MRKMLTLFITFLKLIITNNSTLEPYIFSGQIRKAIKLSKSKLSQTDSIYLYFLERLKWMETGDLQNLRIYNHLQSKNEKNTSSERDVKNTSSERDVKNTSSERSESDINSKNEVPSEQTNEQTNEQTKEQTDEQLNEQLNDQSDDSSSMEQVPKLSINTLRPIFYLLSSKNHSPFYEHILCHNSFFSFISTDNIDIYKTYLKITGKIVTKYLNNRFFFHDKIDYSNIKKYPKPEYLMQLIRAGDKKAEEIFIQMLVTGSLSPVNYIKELIYLSEERKNGKAMTLLGNLYLSNLISNDNSNKDYSIDNSIYKSNKDDSIDNSIDNSNKDDSGKHQQKNENTNNNTTNNNTTRNTENKEKTTVDTTTAMHYFRSAVAMGDFFAYNGLGRLFMMDNHLEQSLARGYFEEAAYRGSAEGDYNLYLYFKKVYGIEDSHRLIRAVKKSYMPALYTYAQRLYKQGEINQAIAHLLPISEYDYPIVALQDQAYIDLKNGKLIECFYKLLFLTETGSINAINNLIYLLTSEKVKNVPCNFFGVSDNTGENNKTEKSHLGENNKTEKSHLRENNKTEKSHLGEDNKTEKSHLGENNKTEKSHLGENNKTEKSHLGEKNHDKFLDKRVLFYLLSKSAHMGQTKHLVSLADCYYYGLGCKSNYNTAYSYYYSAYLYGDAKGAYSLFYCHLLLKNNTSGNLTSGNSTSGNLKDIFYYLYETKRIEPNSYLLIWYMLAFSLIFLSLRIVLNCLKGILRCIIPKIVYNYIFITEITQIIILFIIILLISYKIIFRKKEKLKTD